MMIPTQDQVLDTLQHAKALEDKINNLLSDSSNYPGIIELLSQPWSKDLAVHNQRIYLLHIISQIVNLELEYNVRNVLFTGRNTDQLIRIYRILSLYLRRIEFDLPQELSSGIKGFIDIENISFIAILSIIRNNISIINKDKVTNGVVSLIGGSF